MLRWFRSRFPFSPSPAREQEAAVRLGPARRFVRLSIAGGEQSEKETKRVRHQGRRPVVIKGMPLRFGALKLYTSTIMDCRKFGRQVAEARYTGFVDVRT